MKLNWPIRHETICSGLSWWGAREGGLNQGWTRRSWLDSCTLRERSRAEQRSQSKANKNVAIISENLLHSIALLCSNILVRPAQRRSAHIYYLLVFWFLPLVVPLHLYKTLFRHGFKYVKFTFIFIQIFIFLQTPLMQSRALTRLSPLRPAL